MAQTSSSSPPQVDVRELSLPSGLTARVLIAGPKSGKDRPLVYLHSASAVTEQDRFFLKLAESFEVYAPIAPGFRDLDELENLVTVQDVAVHYDDILTALELTEGLNEGPDKESGGVILVGHSFGGMFAAELAALSPKSVSSLALISPVGLWNEDYPVLDIFAIPPLELGDHLWADPDSEAAVEMMSAAVGSAPEGSGDADSADAYAEAIINTMQGLITAGKYMMPIPDRGLNRRLYRITAPTVLIWGAEDKVVPPNYAKDFAGLLANSKSSEVIIKGAGHMVPQENPSKVIDAIVAHVA